VAECKPLMQVIAQGGAATAIAQRLLALCYHNGEGVEANTVQAALWCRRAADGGDATAADNLPGIRQCNFCGATPVRKLCARCRKTRYCGAACIMVRQ
jgi:hypothetical protein